YCDNCIYGNGKPIKCTACGSMVKGGLCLTCDFRGKNLYNCDPNAYSFDNTNYFPQSQYENHLCSLCGNNSNDGYDCQQQFSFVHEQELSYNQNYDETSNQVFQANHSIQNEESFENPSDETVVSNSNQEKEEPPQDSDICQFIREECCVEVPEKQNALDSKLLLINSNFPVCDNHSDIFSDSKIDDDISVYDDDFEDIEYVEASLSDPKNVSISQIQDVVLREKLLSIIHLISNIESLNDNSTPDRVLNSFASDNSLLDNFSPEFEAFCDHTEETRSGNPTHANYSLLEYDSFCFEIESGQERLINLMKNDISDSSNDPLLEEADLFLSDDSIPPGIENVVDDPEGDIRFLEALLINDSILSHESFDSYFEDNPSIPRPPPEPPDAETDAGKEIPVMMNGKDKFDDDYHYFMFAKEFSLLSAESEDTIFDPGISD
nr:hypothetical protein [Tanacetum cinerariifolium]